jgi:hypothetical protein
LLANHGWKAVSIGAATVSSFPDTLVIQSLRVTSPGTDTVNTVLLNYAGLQTPLVTGDLYVGTNAAFVALDSALQVNYGFTTVEGTFVQDSFSQISTVGLQVTNGGVYAMTNGTLTTIPTERLQGGQFIQAGGSNFCPYLADAGEYELRGGDLVVPGQAFGSGEGLEILGGNFAQSGGTFTGPLTIGRSGQASGSYQLSGGVIISPFLELPSSGNGSNPDRSYLVQSGGTNFAGKVVLGAIYFQYFDLDVGFGIGYYTLSNGLLVTTNLGINGNGRFTQTGGFHTNATMVLTQTEYFHREQPGGDSYVYEVLGSYSLSGGTLISGLIDMEPGNFSQSGGAAEISKLQMGGGQYSLSSGQLTVSNMVLSGGANFTQTGGVITQSGTLTLVDAGLTAGPGSQQFGRLQLSAGAGTNSTFTLSPGACVLHFANSRSLVWSNETLTITNWSGSPSGSGLQQIFFGGDDTGLTAQQLSQVQFSNPAALPSGTYPARILSDGEIVPDQGSQNSSSGLVNSWISPTGGNWSDASSWSLGNLPDSSQSVMITNSGWKAVSINAATPIDFLGSMTVSNLTLRGSTNTLNTLLMNFVGAGHPLVIGVDTNSPGSLIVDSNSAVTMFSSGLIVNNALGTNNSHLGEFEIDGTFNQSDGSEVVAGFLNLAGTYNLTNGELFVGNQFINGTFNQRGGTNLGSVDMETTNGNYQLFDGVMQGTITLRAGTFRQQGGTNFAGLTTGWRGEYDLAGGLLSLGDLAVGSPPQNFLQFAGGGIEQTGGTLTASNVSIVFGFYDLRGGTLSARSLTLTTNTLLGGLYAGHFTQYGGYHTNGGMTMTGGIGQQDVVVTSSYSLNGGTLETPFITVNRGGFNHYVGTNRVGTISMSNASTYVIKSGLLAVDEIQLSDSSFSDNGGTLAGTRNVRLANANWYEWHAATQLGQLQLSGGTNSFLWLQSSPCVVQFADSSSASWDSGERLLIPNWSGSFSGGGSQQIFFGTSAGGLTSQQLSQMNFINPVGLPNGTYSARILSNGEVVPDQDIQRPLTYSMQGSQFVLRWPTGYTLQTATNPAGPYQDLLDAKISTITSPYTNDMVRYPQRFFRLRK